MAIKSYVKIKPIKEDGAYSGTFNQIRKGINRTGVTVTSISHNQVETEKLITFERDWLRVDSNRQVKEDVAEEKQDLNVFQKWTKGFKKMFKFEQRNKKEDKAEKKPGKKKQADPMKEKAKEKALGFFEMIGNFLSPIFDIFVTMAVFKWLSNPEKAKNAAKVFKLVAAIGKFAFKILGFGVNMYAKGITNVFGAGGQTGIAKAFAPLTGLLQLFTGFMTLRYLLNPLKLFSDGTKVKNLFRDTSMKELEWKKQEQWRKFGYKDTETGKIYTEQEYKAQKKSVERQQKKLRAQGRDDQARKVGKQFNTRNNNPTRLQTGKNLGKKAMQPGGMQKGLAVAGGLTRIASGFAMGEDKTEAVGAGLGQAAGGMIGSALLTPFLGPFGPIVGNAIGGFLGEWVGKTFLPVIKPLFEPIQKFFGMAFQLVKDVAGETGVTEFLGTLFKFLGQIGKVMFEVLGWIMKPITWLLSGVIKIIGGIIGFIIKAAKNIFAFMKNPIGFAWKIIRGKDPGKDVKMDKVESFGDGGEMIVVSGKPAKKKPLSGYAGGGKIRKIVTGPEDIEPPTFVYSWTKFTTKTEQRIKNGELVHFSSETEMDEILGFIYYHILLKHHDDILGKLKAMKLIKPTTKIQDLVEGTAGDHIEPKILYQIYEDSKARRISDELQTLRIKAFNKRHGLKPGESWISDFAKGGLLPFKTPMKLPEFSQGGETPDIEAMVAKQQEQHAKFAWKKEKDATVQDIILPPRTVVLKTRVPVINNVAVGTKSRAVTTVPSPMFTC